MNAMMFTEGAPSDYDEWVRCGATGWGSDTIKAYLRKMERHVLHREHPDTTHEYRGDEGRVQTGYSYCGVSRTRARPRCRLTDTSQDIVKDYLRACRANGIESIP
jgi:choline dehydrogenase-like flavoprotein